MESAKRASQAHPKESASFLSSLFFGWAFGIYRQDQKKKLEFEDIWSPLMSQKSDILGDRLERVWKNELKKTAKDKTPSLTIALMKAFSKEWFLLGLNHVALQMMDVLLRPMFLRMMLSGFSMKEGADQSILTGGFGLIATSMLNSLLQNHYNLNSFRLGVLLRVSCISLVYRKSLKLSRWSMGDTSPGHIVNLVSNDVSRFEVVAFLAHFMWSAPVQAMVIAFFLYEEVGIAGVAGLLVVFTVAPIQSFTAKLTSKYRLQTALKTDERIRFTDEVIIGIDVIKMYAWEKPFIKLLEYTRKVELFIIRKSGLMRGLYMTFNIFTTRCAIACTLIAYSVMGYSLRADKVFVVATYFGMISMSMTGMFVRGFAELAESRVSVLRLQKFLLQDEVVEKPLSEDVNKEQKAPLSDDKAPFTRNGTTKERKASLKSEASLEIKLPKEKLSETFLQAVSVTASWDPGSSDPTLQDINFTIRNGALVGIIGAVGSGKTSVLQLLLGEITVTSGEVKVTGTLSYAAQEPWVFSTTVRQNILFGLPYERKRYKEVIKACCLERDLDMFPNGDMTVVGERGSSLSGGQRARINLARAVYRKADAYLLDDPLSAVDAHVSKHIFKHCLRGFLRGKTVLLATHQVQFMRNMDRIIVMEHGQIKQDGRYDEIGQGGQDLPSRPNTPEVKEPLRPALSRMISITSIKSVSSVGEDDVSLNSLNLCDEPEKNKANETNTMYKGNTFWGFFRAGSNPFFIFLVLFLFGATQLLASTNDYWVAYWTTQEELQSKMNSTMNDSVMYISICSGLVATLFFTALSRGMLFYIVCSQCSRGIHTKMVSSVFGTSLNFFQENHSGGILNRFSKDLGGCDEQFPKALLDCGQIFGQVAGALITSSIVNPWFLAPVSVFIMLAVAIRNVCLRTTKNVKRIENMARSPVYSYLNSSLQGLATIRAHKAQQFLKEEFDAHQNVHTSCLYTYLGLQQAYTYLLDVSGLVYLSVVILSFIYFNSGVYGAEVGLAISQTITVTLMLQWGMRQSSELANLMTSIERLLAYTKLPPEEPNKDEKEQASLSWPSSGKVQFKGMTLWYNPSEPPVIENLNCTIKPGEKVGIVGRTGAGKSSLISSLFRLSATGGGILIDDVDTGTVPLETLRSRISIIPQNPVLFSGTIRKNLDPFNDSPDYVLWRALDEVELKEVLKDGQGLETKVSDGGSNLSVGQRQLLCLARAIVRNNKIIVLDEATASVDPQTDNLIQTTIRKRFSNCTVLTVAHRLLTVIDCDRIMVMDAGRLVEFDSPHKLLQQNGGYLYHLVHESGNAMATELTKIAEKTYLRKQQESLLE